jgi:fructan beta-fructosidase
MGEGNYLIKFNVAFRYLMLPIEEAAPESSVRIISDFLTREEYNIRLAFNKTDYTVPLDLEEYKGKNIIIYIHNPSYTERGFSEMAIRNLVFCDSLPACGTDGHCCTPEETTPWRPEYHFTPPYGWMNDPNGLFYKAGKYNLYYQYNPYAAIWGNMHWGHAESTDLVHWKNLPVALRPDALGAIFSGSCIVDKDNTAGFGAGTVFAFYTSAGTRQKQCMAYSTDNGKTFTKYSGNPIITSTETDFRDPKVIWYPPQKKWIMCIAAGQHIEFYTSSNLKEWSYSGKFGDGYGCHKGVWECPDLIKMPVKPVNEPENFIKKQAGKTGTEHPEAEYKWALIVNINPGGPYGGSATQYFIGEFNGKTFSCNTPCKTKWMDYGKDFYAATTWNNLPEDNITLLPWMSNWQYANHVPTKIFRSSMGLPRQLFLYKTNGDYYLGNRPVDEIKKAEGIPVRFKTILKKGKTRTIKLPHSNGTYSLNIKIKHANKGNINITLANGKGEHITLSCNYAKDTISFDRSKSGRTDFDIHFSEKTYSPLGTTSIDIYVDKSSMEIFDTAGKWSMTNLVFPNAPYDRIILKESPKTATSDEGGRCNIEIKFRPITIDSAKN